MASYGVFERDFLTSSWGARPTFERPRPRAVEPLVPSDEAAPETERSPGITSETRIGVFGGAPSETLFRVEEADVDFESEPPTLRMPMLGSARRDWHHVTCADHEENDDEIDVVVDFPLRPSEPTLLCVGVVRPAAKARANGFPEAPASPTSEEVRPADATRRVRTRLPSASPESEVLARPNAPGSGVWPTVVSERILGAVCRLGAAVERWLPSA